MLPSEILRNEIEEKYNINLKQFAWSKELQNKIFNIKLDELYETHASTLEEIYINGFNIGRCGLTSRYITRCFKDAKLFYGKANLLIGTKSAPNGEHAWTTINNYLVDSTLMICIPIELSKKLGYITEKEIAYDSARMLSEYDTFDKEFEKSKNIRIKI